MAQGKILGTPNPNPKHVGISQEEKDALATFITVVEERITDIMQTLGFSLQVIDTIGTRVVRLEELTGYGAPEEPEAVDPSEPASEEDLEAAKEAAEEPAPVGEDLSEAQIIDLAERTRGDEGAADAPVA